MNQIISPQTIQLQMSKRAFSLVIQRNRLKPNLTQQKVLKCIIESIFCQRLIYFGFQACKMSSIKMNKVIRKLSIQARFISTIDLKHNNLSSRTIEILADAGFKYLKELNLTQTKICDDSVSRLVKCQWKYLDRLYLINNRLTNKSLHHLAKCNWPNLQYFYFNQNQISSSGLKCFIKNKWKKLKFIAFCECQMGDMNLYFLQLSSWSRLHKLDIHSTKQYQMFIHANPLAKFPQQLRNIQVLMCYDSIYLNSIHSAYILSFGFENGYVFDRELRIQRGNI